MKIGLVLALFTFLAASPVRAEIYEFELKFEGKAVGQWILVARDAVFEKVLADREDIEGGAKIRADLNDLSDDTLVSFVVIDGEGVIHSTPLASLRRNELEQESVHLAEKQIPLLESQVSSAKKRLYNFESEMKLANLRKRKEHGFDKIDLIYERVAAIQEEIERVKDKK